MAMTPEELEGLAFSNMPEDYVRRAVKAVFAAHRNAWDFSREHFPPTEAENVRPFLRRGYLESYLRDAADLVPGVEADVVRGDHFWNHTEIRSGVVILTESSVPTPCALVERAEFRLTLARSAQLRLFDDPNDPDAPLYAILVHSRYHPADRDDLLAPGHLPGSAYLAFPSPDLASYVHTINLFDRFAQDVAQELPNEWDTEAHVSYFHRARRAASA